MLPNAAAPEVWLEAGYALLLLVGAVGLGLWSRRTHARLLRPPDVVVHPPGEEHYLRAPWPHSEMAHFYHGLALMLVLLAGCLVAVGLARHHASTDLLVLGPILLLVAAAGQWLLPEFLAVHRLLR